MSDPTSIIAAETAARKAFKQTREIKALEMAPDFYERLRETRGYLPTWERLSDKDRKQLAKAAQHVSDLENAVAGDIYRASKRA
jgi:hypothetical protein